MAISDRFRPATSVTVVLGFMLHGLGGLVSMVDANVGGPRGSTRPLVASKWAHTRDVQRSLSEVLDGTLETSHQKAIDVRVSRLQDALRPVYFALPKNARGLLGHSAVRYALHRHFVHRHAMYIKGLEPAGEAWNSSSPSDILEDRVPAYVQHVFEERLHDGFDLKELALLAATLEHFIENEAVERLTVACKLSVVGGCPDTMTEEQLEHILDVYIVLLLQDENDADLTLGFILRKKMDLEKGYPRWSDTQSFMRHAQEGILEKQDSAAPITLAVAIEVVDAFTDGFGRFQDAECRSMAKDLVAKEDHGSGRVKLSDFYSSGFQFMESKEYLMQLGALDDSASKQEPRVIISNYVTSVTNCLGTSSLYSVCCSDPCEDLLGHLERRIAAPDASPERIVNLVAALPSATVGAPRGLSVTLVRRLNEIAADNSGRIQLHGRLFAQWMHHAYPRECSFPHKSGTTKPQTADEWLKETNSSIFVSESERKALMEQALLWEEQSKVKDLVDGDLEETLPWLLEEELVAHRPQASLAHELWVISRSIVLIAVLFSATASLVGISNFVTGTLRSGNAKVGRC